MVISDSILQSGKVIENQSVNLLKAAQSMFELLDSEATIAEQQFHLTNKSVEAMKKAGLYKMLVPKTIGGIEAEPCRILEVIEEISYAYGSAGWCLLNSVFHSAIVNIFATKTVATEVLANRDVVIAGQLPPKGIAIPEADGYRLSGNYTFGSGISQADYLLCGAVISDRDSLDGNLSRDNLENRIFLVNRNAVRVDRDWQVLGLRGTGSFNFSVSDLYVRADYSFPIDLFNEYARKLYGTVYALENIGLSSLCLTGFALGIARRALHENAEIAKTKKTLHGLVGNSPTFQEKFASAMVKLSAARSYCFEVWDSVTRDIIENGNFLDVEQKTLLRLCLHHSYQVALEVCNFSYITSHRDALRDCPLQRCYRDISSAIQHVSLSNEILQDCGKSLLKLYSPGSEWTMHGLDRF